MSLERAGDYAYSDDWSSEERDAADGMLRHLARTGIACRKPRSTTGQIFCWKEGSVVCVRRTETIDRVLLKLSTEGFLSAPVLTDTVEAKYCGMVDILDLLVYTVDVLFKGDDAPAAVDFWQRSQAFKETQVWQVMKHARATSAGAGAAAAVSEAPVDVYHQLNEGYSLLHAFEVLARTGCHRVPVVSAAGRITGIYTESMAISDVRQSMHLMGALADAKVACMPQSESLVTVREGDRAIDGFRKLATAGVSGCPIVDEAGVLTGSLSIRDLRAVGSSGEHFSKLFWSVKDFKAEARRLFPGMAPPTHWTTQTLPRTARYVTREDSFGDVIRGMVDGNLHRLFVVDAESAASGAPVPVAVISQRDVLRHVLAAIGTMRGDVA